MQEFAGVASTQEAPKASSTKKKKSAKKDRQAQNELETKRQRMQKELEETR